MPTTKETPAGHLNYPGFPLFPPNFYIMIPSNSTNFSRCAHCGKDKYGSLVMSQSYVGYFLCFDCQTGIPSIMTMSSTGVV